MNRTPGEFFDAIPPTPSNDDVGTPFLDLIRNVRKADRFVGRQIGRIDGKGWDALKSSGRFLINHHKASTEVHRTMLAERAAQAALEANQEEESLPKRGRWITREVRMSDGSRKTEEVRIATLLEKGRQFVIIGSLIFGAMSLGIGYLANDGKPDSERFGSEGIDHVAEDFYTGAKLILSAPKELIESYHEQAPSKQ